MVGATAVARACDAGRRRGGARAGESRRRCGLRALPARAPRVARLRGAAGRSRRTAAPVEGGGRLPDHGGRGRAGARVREGHRGSRAPGDDRARRPRGGAGRGAVGVARRDRAARRRRYSLPVRRCRRRAGRRGARRRSAARARPLVGRDSRGRRHARCAAGAQAARRVRRGAAAEGGRRGRAVCRHAGHRPRFSRVVFVDRRGDRQPRPDGLRRRQRVSRRACRLARADGRRAPRARAVDRVAAVARRRHGARVRGRGAFRASLRARADGHGGGHRRVPPGARVGRGVRRRGERRRRLDARACDRACAVGACAARRAGARRAHAWAGARGGSGGV
ncbi:putative sorH [Burkholderia mallei]|nr:putative sorH [Burkholderia mallei]KOT16017.1 putative sorH [Burkholderia mallei]